MKNWRNRNVAVAEAISGSDQAGVGVDQPEVDHHLVGRHDAHLDRQHQRDEDHPEEDHPERKAEEDDREGREDRDDDLADRDAERHDAAC